MSLLLLVGAAFSADWLTIQGTEVGQPVSATRPWGFMQVGADGVVPTPVEGLEDTLAPYDGQVASFNRLSPTSEAAWGFNARRVRLGVRGAVPGTAGRTNWMMAAELGNNALTRVAPVVLTDASITLSYVPGLRLRVGHFKVPTSEEALEANPIAAHTANLSLGAAQLLMESPIAAGAYTGGAYGFRDLGLQAFDTLPLGFTEGRWQLSYALMLSDGQPSKIDLSTPKDLSARLRVARVLGGGPADPHRPELSAFVWRTQGERRLVLGEGLEDAAALRVRQGLGLQVETPQWHARAELVHATGMIEAGSLFPGQPISVVVDGEAVAVYGMVHHQWERVGATVRYDQLWRQPGVEADLRVFQTLTLGGEVQLAPRARVLGDVELRRLQAPGANADTQAAAATLGPRASIQAVILF